MTPKTPIPVHAIHVNSIGYLPSAAKTATLVLPPAAAGENASAGGSGIPGESGLVMEVTLVDDAGTSCLTLYPTPLPALPGLDARLWRLDFSSITRPGTYRLQAGDGLQSPVFKIAKGVYDESLRILMKGFYGQRCGCAVSLEHQGKTYAHGPCHLDDGWLEHSQIAESTGATPTGTTSHRDCTGGWHDAGDYGKYIVNAGISMGMMLKAWERFGLALDSLKLPIPESGGPLPDYLAELKFNLDWMLKMQFDDGKVSHKLTRLGFEGMVMPEDDHEKRYYSPWGSDATGAFAATCALAARVYRPYAPAYADTCLEAARKSMEVLATLPWGGVRPDLSLFHTGGYQHNAHSDIPWAWLEWAETSGDPEAHKRAANILDQDNWIADVDWDWGKGKNLGIHTWLRSPSPKDPVLQARVAADLVTAANRLVAAAATHPFHRTLRRNYWGCNGSIARTSFHLLMAYDLTGDPAYRQTALDQISYLYGHNPYGRSFITGDGHQPPLHPHHRPSAADSIADPWPGHLTGGAHPTELDWHDTVEDFRTNEIAINWDAALVNALAAFLGAE